MRCSHPPMITSSAIAFILDSAVRISPGDRVGWGQKSVTMNTVRIAIATRLNLMRDSYMVYAPLAYASSEYVFRFLLQGLKALICDRSRSINGA